LLKCPICGKEIKGLGPLVVHLRKKHGVVDPEARYCPLCGPIGIPLELHCLEKANLFNDLNHAIIYLATKPRYVGHGYHGPRTQYRKKITKLIRKLLNQNKK